MKVSLKKRYIRDETVAGIETQFREHLKSSTDVSSIMLRSLQKTHWQTTLKCPVISPDTHLKASGRKSWWIEERHKVLVNHKSLVNHNIMQNNWTESFRNEYNIELISHLICLVAIWLNRSLSCKWIKQCWHTLLLNPVRAPRARIYLPLSIWFHAVHNYLWYQNRDSASSWS